MGNQPSSPAEDRRKSSKKSDKKEGRAKHMASKFSSSIQSSMKKLEEDSFSSKFIDNMCGAFFDDDSKLRSKYSASSYGFSEDVSEEDSRRTFSEDDTIDEYDRRRKAGKKELQSESDSYMTHSETESEEPRKKAGRRGGRLSITSDDSESFISEGGGSYIDVHKSKGQGVVAESAPDARLAKPLASSFAKRCYFTKAGIGKTTQHYEGLTLTGNVVLMLSSAMKLKGCPTICDEDLRRVEQTYPNQFSRLPDELLLSSGWRRISKYCHFSGKPIPDGIPFFHSRRRLHPNGGYYFLLAAAVGMIRPIDVEPLTRDTLVLLETDYPTQCDAAPPELIEDATQWTLVDKFCFFSGGPINTEEDVYYEADFDGNLIYMLAFLSPSLTPDELYKLSPDYNEEEPGLKSVAAVEEVESVYDLTERDFDDLKLYHLGPCRALPPYILVPEAWTKVLPPHFLAARQEAMMRALAYEQTHGVLSPTGNSSNAAVMTADEVPQDELPQHAPDEFNYEHEQAASVPQSPNEQGYYSPDREAVEHPGLSVSASGGDYYQSADEEASIQQQFSQATREEAYVEPRPTFTSSFHDPNRAANVAPNNVQNIFQREVEEEGAFIDSDAAPMDEAIARHQMSLGTKSRYSPPGRIGSVGAGPPKMDPPVDEPPSLSRLEAPDDEGDFQDQSPGHSQAEYDSGYGEEIDYSAGMGSETIPNEEYYHEEEYYDSPEKSGQNYYPREEEYYDSPENMLDRDMPFRAEEAFSEEPLPQEPSFSPDDYAEEYVEESPEQQPPGQRPQEPSLHSSYYTNDSDSGLPNVAESGRGFAPIQNENVSPDNSYGKIPQSPSSEVTQESSSIMKSDYSQSSAMRSAHEMLRRNRQRRNRVVRNQADLVAGPDDEDEDEYPARKNDALGRWETQSDMNTSVVSGSSVWTDASSAADRGSRRALILQMAKARMRSSKTQHSEDKKKPVIAEEESLMSIGEQTEGSKTVAELDFSSELD